MSKIYNYICLVTISFIVFACSKTATTYDCTGVTSSYATQIKPIMDASCALAGCHSAYGAAKGIDLSSYGQTKVNAGKESFMGSMQHLSGYNSMPQGGSMLSDDKLKLISCWIKNGMPQ
jgi:cytochrome c5